jgi:multiple sugar transport system ATP-binding protein
VAQIQLRGVTKRYPDGTEAVKAIDLDIGDGEFMILVGPSGCGKSTALRMIAGLEDISEGELYIGDEVVNDLAPKDRDIAMVFQNYALYPHMTVRENMGFALKLAKVDQGEINTKVEEAARILDLQDHLDRKPANLSGGQRQRVAMGRAIVRDPKVFLMDEPLSNLDAKLRVQMRTEVSRIQKRLGTTMVYVTHDQTEAMTLGDRVAVMRAGVIQQVDAPKVLYSDPVNLFVAGFIGSPAMNFLPARLEGDRLELPFGSTQLPGSITSRIQGNGQARDVIAGLRPEHFEDAALADERHHGGMKFKVGVDVVESMGSELYAYFDVEAKAAESEELAALAEDAGLGELPGAGASGGATHVVARLDSDSGADAGKEIELVLDTSQIKLFDPNGGRSLTAEGARRPAAAGAGTGTAAGTGAATGTATGGGSDDVGSRAAE